MNRIVAALIALAILVSPSSAQLPGMQAYPLLNAGTQVNIQYIGTTADVNNLTTYTFAGTSIGTAATDRVIVVGVIGAIGATRNISTVTIDGNATTQIAQAGSGGDSALSGLYWRAVPSGTTASIVVNFDGGMARAAIAVWAVYGANTTSPVADFASDSDTTGLTLTSQIDIPNGGAAIAISNISGTTVTGGAWTGVNEDFDDQIETTSFRYSGAHQNSISQQTNRSVDITWSAASGSRSSLVSASFTP